MSNFITIKLRRGTAAQWASTNPVLAEGEFGAETDTRKFKIGNGVTAWNSLQYWGGSGGGAADFTDLGDVPPSYTGQAGKYVKVNGTADGLEFGTLTIAAADLPTGIDAAKIADGTVSNTEFQYLNGVTAAIQTQLDGKAPLVHTHVPADIINVSHLSLLGRHAAGTGSAQEITLDGGLEFQGSKIRRSALTGDVTASAGDHVLTIANGAVTNDKVASGIDAVKIANGTVSNTEFQYLDGVTGAIQTQIDGKAATVHTHDANAIVSGTIDGDRLPAISTTKKGAVPATGTPTGKYLKDDGTWASLPGGSATWGAITGTLSSQTDLQTALDGKVDENAAIIGATKTKITYDAKGLVTAGTDATTADIADSTDKRYVTEAEKTKLASTSGTNTGDQTITLTGDVTGSGTGSFAASIANNAVTLAKIQDLTTARILGRVTAGTGDPEQLTGTQVTTLLDTFTSSLKGLAPASGGGTTNFLRADGTWVAPSGGGGGGADGTVLSPSQITAWQNNYNPSGWANTVGVLRINSNQFHFLSGLTATSGGHTVRVFNTGSFPIGLYNQNTDSTAANRFSFDDHDVILLPSQSVELFYDNTAARWRLADSYTLTPDSPFVARYWNECVTTAGDSHGASNALWPTAGSGTYTAGTVGSVGNGGKVGIIVADTGTGATNRAQFYVSQNDIIEYFDGTGRGYQEFRAVFRTPANLSDATNNYLLYAGFLDSITAEPSDGAWIRYNHADNSGNWQFVAGDAGVRNTQNSSVAVSTNAWLTVRCVMYPNGTAEFYINGTSLGRITSGLPGADRDYSLGINIRKTAGTAARSIAIDGVGYTIVKYTKQ